MTGIDHLADHLSIQDYQVDGHSGFQAGKGGSLVCCAKVPTTWQKDLKVHLTWNMTNWRDRTSQEPEQDVEVEPYDEPGTMHVHFLADGRVCVLLSNHVPWAKDYPGPRGIPQKRPGIITLGHRPLMRGLSIKQCLTAADHDASAFQEAMETLSATSNDGSLPREPGTQR
jgi:hypothetical protein